MRRGGEIRGKKVYREQIATKSEVGKAGNKPQWTGTALAVNRGTIRHMSQENGSITLYKEPERTERFYLQDQGCLSHTHALTESHSFPIKYTLHPKCLLLQICMLRLSKGQSGRGASNNTSHAPTLWATSWSAPATPDLCEFRKSPLPLELKGCRLQLIKSALGLLHSKIKGQLGLHPFCRLPRS